MMRSFGVPGLFIAALLALTALSSAQKQIGKSHFEVDAPVFDLQWIGQDRKIVFLQTEQHTIYRSLDEGKTWQSEMEKMPGSTTHHGDAVGIYKMVPSPADHNTIAMIGWGPASWISKDGGNSYVVMQGGHEFDDLEFHPKEKDAILGTKLSPGCHTGDEPCWTLVLISRDGGQNWKQIATHSTQVGWGNAGSSHASSGTIYMTALGAKEGNQQFAGWDYNVNFEISHNYGESFQTVLAHGNRFIFQDNFLFVAVANEDGETVTLYVKDYLRAGETPYERTWLPGTHRGLPHNSYTILDTSEGSVFLHINHYGAFSEHGFIYTSDSTGTRYVPSLALNKRDVDGRCDFEKVRGVEGVYLANVLERAPAKEAEHSIPAVSRVTFNKGGIWHALAAPVKDSLQQDTHCIWEGDHCALHLNGLTNNFGPFYTTDNAPGLIMATGNTGHSLLHFSDQVNTYFSRDAGRTWQEVKKGSHIYEFGDHGAIIVMVDNLVATDTLYYSWTQGGHWETFKFADAPIHVTNVIVEPTATSQQFLVYGTHTTEQRGVVVHVDFTELHQRQCAGQETPDTPNSDYEFWTPHDWTSPTCLMGHRMKITRRKAGAECFNGVQHEKVQVVENCPCTQEDYECDIGYHRQEDLCVAEEHIKNNPPDECSGPPPYVKTQGYRRIAGNTCDNTKGVNLDPKPAECSLLSHHGMFVTVVVLFAVALVGGITYLTKNDELRDRLLGWTSSGIPSFPKVRYGGLESTVPESAVDGHEFGLEEDDEADALVLDDGDQYEATYNTGGSQPTSPAAPPPAQASPVPPSNPPPAVDLLTGDDFNPRT